MTSGPGAPAVVALGSNLGDSRLLVTAALRRLQDRAGNQFRASSLYVSAPVDCPAGSSDFVNAVCLFVPQPGETPESLLGHLLALEREFGRRPKTVDNEPRPLDLDLIAFGSATRTTAALTLPHPRAHLRRFVLEPLCEIAPDLQPPSWPAPAARLLASLPAGELVARLAPPGPE
jgi:2-amino-4-hydroxy-6-hydroxymethyldihydropteridine diphosphokinase